MPKPKNSKTCAWRGCKAAPTRVLTWAGGVQQDLCDYHADEALKWAALHGEDNDQGEQDGAEGK
jgi:hypothetical protein